MKKLALLLALVVAFPALASAQKYPYGPEGKKMDGAEILLSAINKKLTQKEKEIIDERLKYRDLHRTEALEQGKKATEALSALMEAYPEYKEVLEDISFMHTYFVEFAEGKRSRSVKQVYGYIFQQLESFYQRFEKLPEEVAEQALEIVDHDYWIEISQENLSLKALGNRAKVVTGVYDTEWF